MVLAGATLEHGAAVVQDGGALERGAEPKEDCSVEIDGGIKPVRFNVGKPFSL